MTSALETGELTAPVLHGCAPGLRGALDVTAVHEAYADFVWRSLQRLGVRDADLDDLLQEVFVVVHRKLQTLASEAQIASWLFGIATRVAAAHRRRSYVRREQPVAVPEDEPSAADEGPEAIAATRQARAQLEAILDEMEIDKRAVFVMFEIDELECEQIAHILGVPVGTVYSRLHAARKAFDKGLVRARARDEHAARAGRRRSGEGGAS